LGGYCGLTPRRIASQQRAQAPHSAPGASRKDALWGCHSHEKAHSACGPHQRAHSACGRWLRREPIFADLCTLLRPHVCPQRRNSVHKCPKTAPRAHFRRSVYTPASPRLPIASQQCTQMPQNGAERLFSPICVHSCIPTAARATGRGHGSYDTDGPMALVMPGRSGLRFMPLGR